MTEAEVEFEASDYKEVDAMPQSVPAQVETVTVESAVEVRDMAKREIDVRVLPWNTVIDTIDGTEEFERGAFDHVDPSKVLMMGLEHEVHLGMGSGGQPVLTRHPVGRGINYANEDDGPHMTFRVAKTQRGDEVLALAAEGIVTGVSAEFKEVPGGTKVEVRNGRRHRRHLRSDLQGLSTTYRPAYGEQAAVLAVRSQPDEGDAPMAETPAPDNGATETPVPAPVIQQVADYTPLTEQMQAGFKSLTETFASRFEKLEEQTRMQIDIPSKPEQAGSDFGIGQWTKLVLSVMSGDRYSERDLQTRIVADQVTAENLGVVPPMFAGDVRETIDTSRPFLESTRRLNIPASGMTLTVPVLKTRPTTGVQSAEKSELASSITEIDPGNFEPVTIGGYGDISLQLLKRSDPSYLELYVDLLAEAYGIDADDEAVNALLAETAVEEGGSLDPEDLSLGTAWANAVAVSRRLAPDRIWLSSAAVAAFIDAKANGTNAPLYTNLEGNFTAGGGTGGTISGLRPVHVPALDDEAVDIIVGPSRGFGWAEDGTYTLQVDVPARAGRDVGLVGMLWYAPMYPAAFTTYTLAGS